MPHPQIKDLPRYRVALALAGAAQHYPDLPPVRLDTVGLSARDAALALAIHRTTLQHWITIEHLLDQLLRRPSYSLEPSLRGLLLSAGAQILFFDRLPRYAVVDESVELARSMIRPGAAGLVNAVLRRLSDLIVSHVTDQEWQPASDRIPLPGGYIALRESALPEPNLFDQYLAAATSHPLLLVRRWLDQFGRDRARQLCLHGTKTPPTIVAHESSDAQHEKNEPDNALTPHAIPGFSVWNGTHAGLMAYLDANAARRVQDPASAQAVAATAAVEPKVILDVCAGRGTKTRQLAARHPQAQIFATDPDAERLDVLRKVAGVVPSVRVLDHNEAANMGRQSVDLLVLDVPWSNTGVLARRPEARYRFGRETLKSLTALQQNIAAAHLPLVRQGGYILYSTCSLEDGENHNQTIWLIKQSHGKIIAEDLTFPDGDNTTYHDGGYYSLVKT